MKNSILSCSSSVFLINFKKTANKPNRFIPYFYLLIAFLSLGYTGKLSAQNQFDKQQLTEGTQLIKAMTDALGGLDKYRKLKDVTYTYTYRDIVKGVQDVSTEKFLYEGDGFYCHFDRGILSRKLRYDTKRIQTKYLKMISFATEKP